LYIVLGQDPNFEYLGNLGGPLENCSVSISRSQLEQNHGAICGISAMFWLAWSCRSTFV
jgi:hypothetical protein